MIGLGPSDVTIQVFPLVQFIPNIMAMRGGTTTVPQPILQRLASVFYSSNRALIVLCLQIAVQQIQGVSKRALQL